VSRGRGLLDVVAVWALFALAALAVLITYSRVPPAELYNTSVGGLRGGAGRTLVFLNYPLALVAVAIIVVCADRLADGRRGIIAAPASSTRETSTRSPSTSCRRSASRSPWRSRSPSGPTAGLRRRRAIGYVWCWRSRLVLAIPWFFAEAGFYAPDPIYADERPETTSGEQTLAAVHLGFHHGTAGVELALAALLLSRTIARFTQRRLAVAASAYVSLMLAYGIANAVQDAWGEQVVKRGWTTAAIPSLLLPSLSPWWALIVAATVLVWLTWFRPARAR
jgi:hypothetical protein